MQKNKYLQVLIPVFLVVVIIWATAIVRVPQKTTTINNIGVENTTSTDDRFVLGIPKISIVAPIIPDVPGNDRVAYDEALEKGVAQYLGTGKPGEGKNIFIFGHSSNYFWAPGDFKDVFKNLSQLSENDEITILYRGKEFKYVVTKKMVVKPSQTDVLLGQNNSEQLTLMTCTPVGTTLNRLIIIANPLSQKP